MIRTKTASLTHKLLLCLACMTVAAIIPNAVAAGAEGTITYTHESYQSYEKQLAAGQVQAVTINKRLRSLHVTLKDGSHVLAKYAAHEEPKVVSGLKAKGVTPTIESKAQALKEATKPAKHKLRYIAGGILVVVVVVVGAVLLVDRRRKHEQE
jgi:hypothetical protein